MLDQHDIGASLGGRTRRRETSGAPADDEQIGSAVADRWPSHA